MESPRIETFDDWKDRFQTWQKGIDYDTRLFSTVLKGYEFGEKFSPSTDGEIGFGEFSYQRKWDDLKDLPRTEVRDLLLRLIAVQGDTEFASVEQQRRLIGSAPTKKDEEAIIRINAEEMRHGWQMSYLLVKHFGDTGKAEARKLLERCADRGERILGAFNEPVEDWLDFFTFTAFVDRDGMYQLKMLSHSGFAPLSRSMGPMLNEESFHLITGLTGLQRILRAGKMPVALVQKVINRWLSVCFDLFGHERSRTAGKAYLWGLKGRFNEPEAGAMSEPDRVNEIARGLYHREVKNLIDLLNREVPEDQVKLYVPDLKFHRQIGEYQNQRFSVTGDPMEEAAYETYLREVLPTAEDRKKIAEVTKERGWIAE